MERPDDPALAFLQSPGDMGRLIGAYAWDEHPLGPPESWPQSLKTALSLILNSQHPMWIGWGPQASFLYNDAYLHVLGLAKHPWALGRPVRQVWGEIWEEIGPLVEGVFRRGEPSFVDDMRLFMRRGDFVEETYYSFSYSPIRDESGAVGGLFCPSNDVSPKIIGARRLRSLSELAANALVEKTTSGASAAAAATLAKNPADLPFVLLYLREGEQLRLAESVGLTAPPPISWPLEDVMHTGTARHVVLRDAPGLPLGLAEQPIAEALALPVTSLADTRPLGVLVAGINPTLRLGSEYRTFLELVAANIATAVQNAKAAEDERGRADALAELDRAKTMFFSNVSHEFRTPLTLLLAPLDELLTRTQDDAESHALTSLAQRNALRLQKLANALLDFSRIEAGRAAGQFAPTDLAVLTADLASNFRSACERAGLSLAVDAPPLPTPAYVDRTMWEKIVLNLLSNAFKFTFQGGITVDQHASGDAVVLQVSDSGVGIPADQLPRIFERFHRIEGQRSRTHEGSGIGLALVQELVHMHGGSVEIESEVGVGTTVTVRLPLGDAHLDPRSIAGEEGASTTSAVREYLAEVAATIGGAAPPVESLAKADRGRILLADDNPDLREYVARVLSVSHDVVGVADGVAALAAVRRESFDLLITDVMMPRMDGFALLAAIRGDARLRTLPVVMLSARAGEESAVEGLNRGADDYLTKPFSANELLARVNAQINAARERLAKLDEDLRTNAWFDAPGEERISATSFRAIADQMPFIVWLQDASGRVSFCNDAFYAFTRLPPDVESLTATAWATCIHPDDLPRVLDVMSRAIEAREAFDVELRIRPVESDESAYRWFIHRALPQYHDGVFQGWLGTSTDVQAQKDVLDRTKRVVQTLQEGFLPTHLPRTARLRVDAVYQAAEADALVGGDWFDAVELPDGRTLISVGDVTGHGLGASSLAARLRHAILDFALDEPDPANVLASANRVLQLERPGTFATALVAFVDAAGETLAYATAGHPPPLLARTSHEPAEELRAGGITLGVESAFETTTIRVALSPGAVAAFYTDGVVEFAREPAIAEARLRAAVARLVDDDRIERPALVVRDAVLDGAATTDDAALLIVRFLAGPGFAGSADGTRRWEYDARDAFAARACRRDIMAHLREYTMSPDVLFESELILGELLANTVEYAPGPVDVQLAWSEGRPALTVRDGGPGMPASNASNAPTRPEGLSEHGRGLFLVRSLGREVTIATRPDEGTTITVVLPFANDR
jgi:signal transduction histidine kinase/CheY-like chemotaxis protein